MYLLEYIFATWMTLLVHSIKKGEIIHQINLPDTMTIIIF